MPTTATTAAITATTATAAATTTATATATAATALMLILHLPLVSLSVPQCSLARQRHHPCGLNTFAARCFRVQVGVFAVGCGEDHKLEHQRQAA
jgi:hypothetical protein